MKKIKETDLNDIYFNSINNLINNAENLRTHLNDFKRLYITALNCLNKGGKIVFAGNGGSAAESQHFNAELIGKFHVKNRKPIPSISLTTDTSIITSIGNDMGFEKIFQRQIEALVNKNDLIIFLTTSGESLNIIKSLNICKKKKIKTCVITSVNSKKINCDIQLRLPGKTTDRNQEMHLFIGHLFCDFLEKSL